MDSPNTSMLADLEPEKFLFAEDILMAILHLNIAEDAFAQVLDGVPTRRLLNRLEGCARSHLRLLIGICRQSNPEQYGGTFGSGFSPRF